MQGFLGATALHGVLPVWVETGSGRLSPSVSFRVDSGAMFTSVGVDVATVIGIPVPPDGSPEYDLDSGTASETTPVRVRTGRLRAWWTPDRQGDPFEWPILFYTAPHNRRKQKALLGLGGVITTCSWMIIGPTDPESNDGYISFADIRPLGPNGNETDGTKWSPLFEVGVPFTTRQTQWQFDGGKCLPPLILCGA